VPPQLLAGCYSLVVAKRIPMLVHDVTLRVQLLVDSPSVFVELHKGVSCITRSRRVLPTDSRRGMAPGHWGPSCRQRGYRWAKDERDVPHGGAGPTGEPPCRCCRSGKPGTCQRGAAFRDRDASLTFLDVRGAMSVYPLRAVFSSRPCVPTPRLLWSATSSSGERSKVRQIKESNSPANDVLVHLACDTELSEVMES
jgi:hypothetical protein